MRKIFIVLLSILSTGCATVPQQQTTTEQEVRQKQFVDVAKGVIALAAILYVANEVADKNRNKQCVNDKILYQGSGTNRYYVCPGKLP